MIVHGDLLLDLFLVAKTLPVMYKGSKDAFWHNSCFLLNNFFSWRLFDLKIFKSQLFSKKTTEKVHCTWY